MISPAPDEPVILLDPHPRRIGRIFDEPTKRRLEKIARVLWHDGTPAPAEHIDRYLPQTIALIGQSPLDKARLNRAPRLRAVFNVESNFLLNVDYAECQRRGIPVLSTAPVYARPVAELALAMAISLARRMHEADAAVRTGREFKGDNHDSFLLHDKPLAIIGFGNLGRALLPLLRPFSREILIHDPWVDAAVLRTAETIPASLDECLPLIIPGDGTSLWTITHNSDFAQGLIGLFGHPGALGEAIHITSDEALTWNRYFALTAEAAAVTSPKFVHIASDFIIACVPTVEGTLLGDKAVSAVFDNTKLKRLVPGFAAKTPFATGIRRTLAWFEADPARQQIDAELNQRWDKLIAVYNRGLTQAKSEFGES